MSARKANILLVIALGAIIALSGCIGQAPTPTPTPTPVPSPTPSPTAPSPTPSPTPKKEKIRIGVLFSLTGAFAPAGALAGYRGTMIAIDMINDRGGILGKYLIEPVVADAQSNPEVAVREAKRLITVEKVPIIVGVYSSGIAIPVTELCEKYKTVTWIIIAISDKVTARHFNYTFRVQPRGSAWGESTVRFIASVCKEKLGKDPSELKIAIIHEDGPYGVSVSNLNEKVAKEYGMQIVLKEAYSHKATDLSPLITKLKAAEPDVIFHTGYFPDIVLFLRQAKELGLKMDAYLGHGAGHANPMLLAKEVGEDVVNYMFNVDPCPAQLLIELAEKKPGIMPKEMVDLLKEFLDRYYKKYNDPNPPTHATQGFAHTWVLLTDVLPRAIQKYGKVTADTIAAAARECDIPQWGTPAGYGVKFAGPGEVDKWGVPWQGQNKRSFPVVYQWVNGKFVVVYPPEMATGEPVIPLPPDSPFSRRKGGSLLTY